MIQSFEVNFDDIGTGVVNPHGLSVWVTIKESLSHVSEICGNSAGYSRDVSTGGTPTGSTLDNPFFARLWTVMSSHETPVVRRLREQNLAGLSGRVLEIGAGTGTNFAFYPDTVRQVIALEPETRLAPKARQAAASAPVPVTVFESTVESLAQSQPDAAAEPFDAVVCSLVLCSVDDPESVLCQVKSVLKPGGELRYFEHVASSGWRGALQRIADATAWPRLFGNCHTHRDTERAITAAGFTLDKADHRWTFPAWAPMPVSEIAIGRALAP